MQKCNFYGFFGDGAIQNVRRNVTHTLQQPGVKGDDSHHLHSVVRQDDPKAEQQEGYVLIDTSANYVQRWDNQHDQQQRRLVARNGKTCREEHKY